MTSASAPPFCVQLSLAATPIRSTHALPSSDIHRQIRRPFHANFTIFNCSKTAANRLSAAVSRYRCTRHGGTGRPWSGSAPDTDSARRRRLPAPSSKRPSFDLPIHYETRVWGRTASPKPWLRNTLMAPRQKRTYSRQVPGPVFVSLTVLLYLGVATAGPTRSTSTFRGQIAGPGVANHPVAVIPSDVVTVPWGWPLNDRGAITCLTCHTGIPNETDSSDPMLRDYESSAAPATAFCAKCHDFGQLSAKSIHWVAIGEAHIRPEHAGLRESGGRLDSQMRQCFSCHDGAMASEADNTIPSSRMLGYTEYSGRNHPVGVRYTRGARPRHLSPLRPSSMLPPEVRLSGGKVSCMSCHDLYAGSPNLLTVPIRGSRLCLTCHAMD